MNKYLSRLTPQERRFVVGVAMLLFVVINLVWVRPHFSDWSNLKNRLSAARSELSKRETATNQIPILTAKIKALQRDDTDVPPEDQAIQLLRTIQAQTAQTGVQFLGNNPPLTRTNQSFMEQIQTIHVQAMEKQLVDFLYNLGAGNSLVRVRALTVYPDAPRQHLHADITFVASYQKKPPARPAPSAAAAKPDTKPVLRPAAPPPKKPAPPPSTQKKK